ncbi:sensor histidine kinase [Sphingomonas sp. HDW15A]|uniref:sensor histidine kinase n=1 Tax=Sphingomonas sp. HDW15A TaxID=2714942 RepID=UPI001408FAB3|nr:sensor histidine kinase [Sphingomonas sp. HDW15A]QIK95855.1 sensor histidine kinase [Sphingomonas sp. HDW15A]
MRRILRSRLPQRWQKRVPELATEFLVGVLVAMLVVVARIAILPFTGSAAPYALNFIGVLLATLLAGWRSGIVATAIAQALTAYYITGMANTFDLDQTEWNGLILATFAELTLILIVALYQREIDHSSGALQSQLSVRELLVAELNHRVKNTLSLVQSLAHQSFTSERDRVEALDAYEGRLLALAAAHDLLTQENWKDASMHDLAHKALGPFASADRLTIKGPEWKLKPSSAVTVCLALHELATNAAKYGALSEAGGRVSLSWGLSDSGTMEIRWSETGAPSFPSPRLPALERGCFSEALRGISAPRSTSSLLRKVYAAQFG